MREASTDALAGQIARRLAAPQSAQAPVRVTVAVQRSARAVAVAVAAQRSAVVDRRAEAVVRLPRPPEAAEAIGDADGRRDERDVEWALAAGERRRGALNRSSHSQAAGPPQRRGAPCQMRPWRTFRPI